MRNRWTHFAQRAALPDGEYAQTPCFCDAKHDHWLGQEVDREPTDSEANRG